MARRDPGAAASATAGAPLPSASALPLATDMCRLRGRLCGLRCAAWPKQAGGEHGPGVDHPWIRGGQVELGRPSQGGQREAVGAALLGARGGSVRARHLGVVRTAGLLCPFTFFWEIPVRILRPLHRGRRGRPPEGGGVLLLVLLRLVGGLGLLLLLLRALRGRRLLLQLLLLRLLPGNLLLLLLLLFFPRSWTR